MKKFIQIFSVFMCFFMITLPLHAAQEWGIEGEKTDRFEAKVVDLACELKGDCPPNCGAGKRQLGLLKTDGTLVLPAKNFDIFAGTVTDLLPFCNQQIIADGLTITNDKMNLFALQFLRKAPDGEWLRANSFIKQWSEKNPALDGASWFRHDERVKVLIETDGVFGVPGLKPEE